MKKLLYFFLFALICVVHADDDLFGDQDPPSYDQLKQIINHFLGTAKETPPTVRKSPLSDYPIQKDLLLSLLEGPIGNISESTIQQHFGLYKHHVSRLNSFIRLLRKMEGGAIGTADRMTRYGKELNSVVLHELFFSNLDADPENPSSFLKDFFELQFGGMDAFRRMIKMAASGRSPGWVVAFCGTVPHGKPLASVQFVQNDDMGALLSFQPFLVIDCWEHAYLKDYGMHGRSAYVEDMMKYVDWNEVERRIRRIMDDKVIKREYVLLRKKKEKEDKDKEDDDDKDDKKYEKKVEL